MYIIGTFLTPYIPDRIEKRFTLIVSCFLMGVCLFFVGPSKLFGLEESLTLMIIGLFLTANFLAPTVIPVLPEILAAVEEKVDKSEMQKAGDYSGALLNTALGLGQVLGPLMGASFYAQWGFRTTEDIIALLCITLSILYFTFAGGYTAFKQTFRGKAAVD